MILDGKSAAREIIEELKKKIASSDKRSPCLAVLLVGEHPASQIYVQRKIQACSEVGILSRKIELPKTASTEDVLRIVEQLNHDPDVDGILIQLPLPAHIPVQRINHALNPEKDVDGFHPVNIGKLLLGETDGFIPCTPLGIVTLLEMNGVHLAGKNGVILGRSNIVGKPLGALLMQNSRWGNATVTIAHSKTENIAKICKEADFIIAAMGHPNFVKEEMVKEGAIVVDVGINRIHDTNDPKKSKIVGDVDFKNVEKKAAWITPVPNGIGPMTIAMLMSNTLKSFFKLLLCLICLTSCQSTSAPPLALHEFNGKAMTIDYRIFIGDALTSAEKNAIEETIALTFNEVNAIYNSWNDSSEVSKLNRLPKGEKVPLSPKLEHFLKVTEEIVRLSDQRFDPTIAPLKELWRNALNQGREPTSAELMVIAPAVGWSKIHYGDGYFYKDHSLTSLDFGGIAKGFCVDLLIERIANQGFDNIYVSWGGEIRAIGEHPLKMPWTVSLSDGVMVPLQDAAMATTGENLRNWTFIDKNSGREAVYLDIIDIRTYRPIIAQHHSIVRTSVLAGNCTFADGLATVAMIFDTPQDALRWCEKIKSNYPTVRFWLNYN